MDRCKGMHVFVVLAVGFAELIFLTGCEPAMQGDGDIRVGPVRGKRNITEAVAEIQNHRQNIKAVRAGGNCLIEWYQDDGNKHKENPAIQLRLYPPDCLYFSGDILGGEAIRLGTNADEFWLRMKPKEISSYWWGKRAISKSCGTGSYLSPETLLDALGMVQVDTSWSFTSRHGYDILTLHDDNGRPVKRIHVDWRDYLVKRIEYFDTTGLVTVVVKPGQYTTTGDGPVVPARIQILHLGSNEGGVSIDITLRDIRPFEPTQAQLQGKLFSKPGTEGFDNIYVLNADCEFVRQEP